MEIESLRDWVIVIFGFLGIGATLLFIILTLMIYRKITPILNSAKEAADTVRNTSNTVSKTVIEPLAKVQGIVSGIKKASEMASFMNKRKGEDEKDGK